MVFIGISHRLTRLVRLTLLALVFYGGGSGTVTATEYSTSFKDADINEFINIVGKNLHKTIILDPGVRGKVSVRSYNKLNETQYYQFFLNVLEVHGFAVIEMSNGILKVIKAKDAKESGAPVVDGTSTLANDEMVTRVVPVANVSARELAPLLRKLNDSSDGGNVAYYDPANVIMLTGRAGVINSLVEIIERVDKAGNQDVDIIKLKFASVLEVADIVESMVASSDTKNSTSNILKPRIVADERTNSLIISGEPKIRQRIIKLIESLDTEEKHSSNNIRVFYLQYATASEVVSILQGISGSIQNSPASQSSGVSQDSQGSSGRNNATQNKPTQGNTAQSNPTQSNPTQTSSSNSGKSSSSSQSDTSIQSDIGTNSIIISAQPEMMASLSDIIRQLDIRRAQVLVEAIIVEVSEADGISLNAQIASSYGGTSFSDNGASSGDMISAYISATEDDDYDDAADVLSSISGGIFGVGDSDWAFILQAVSNSSTANLLSTPSITTLDNQEATFVVGNEVPVLTGSTTTSSSDTFQTVEREEVGIKLTVTPQISKGNNVKMVIAQEVSSVQGATSVDIIFATRSVKTTVLAKSGQTIILGGLISEEVNESVEKVPLLGDIPWIGNLFKSTISTTEKSNLMVFLRATIVRDDETMGALSSRKYNLIREVQEGQRASGINLMPNSSAPILPEWGQSHEINPDDFSGVKNSKKVQSEEE